MSLDRVGRWSVEKLEMLSEYSHAYAVIMNAQKRSRPGRRAWLTGFYYVDTFAGPGIAESKADPEVIEYLEGSPLRAVDCSPPFDHLWFIDRNSRRLSALRQLLEEHGALPRSTLRRGDSNLLLTEVISSLSATERAIVFLDPYGLQVEWDTVRALASSRKADVFINFSLMGVFRNLRLTGGPSPAIRERLAAVMFSTEWIDRLYVQQSGFWSEPVLHRRQVTASEVCRHYRDDLTSIFPYVSNAAIMTNSRGGPIYALVLASHNERAAGIMNDIIGKYQLQRQ